MTFKFLNDFLNIIFIYNIIQSPSAKTNYLNLILRLDFRYFNLKISVFRNICIFLVTFLEKNSYFIIIIIIFTEIRN